MFVTPFLVFFLSHFSIAKGSCTGISKTNSSVPQSLVDSLTRSHRVSPGIACGKSGLTPQYYVPGYDLSDPDQAKNFKNLCSNSKSACPMTGVGSLRLTGSTDLTSQQQSYMNESAVLDLAAKNLFRSHSHHTYSKNLTGQVQSRTFCLDNGSSGWVEWTPRFACGMGKLTGCTGVSKPLQGSEVAVCLPSTLTGSLPATIAGKAELHTSSASEASKKKGNPTRGPDVPGKGYVKRASVTIAATVSMFVAFCTWV